jgi:hypothetical protein
MLMPIPIRAVPNNNERRNSDAIRRRALERLYLRKAAVDELIASLENYVRTQRTVTPAPCIPFNATQRWSSDSAR